MKYRIIIFEGNEAVGKSTLKSKFELATNFKHLCIDRMFVTSLVYNNFKKRHQDLDSVIRNDLDQFIKTFNPLFVYLTSDLDIIKNRFERRGDWYIKFDELKSINQLYGLEINKLIKIYPNNFLILENNKEEDLEKNINLIREAI